MRFSQIPCDERDHATLAMASPNPKPVVAAQWEFLCEQVAAFEKLVTTVDANSKYFEEQSASPGCTVPAVPAEAAGAHKNSPQMPRVRSPPSPVPM